MGVTTAVVLGAGKAARAGRGINKVYLDLCGLPMIVRAIRPFVRCSDIDEVIVVAASDEAEMCTDVLESAGIGISAVIEGAETRHGSETRAIDYLTPRIKSGDIDIVLIHDGARPMFLGDNLDTLIESARKFGGAIYGMPMDEPLQRSPDGHVATFVDENGLWRAQTPQAFQAKLLLEAFARAREDGFEGTDTSASVENIGGTVVVVQGDARNVKVTYPDDLILAEALIRQLEEGQGSTGARR